MNAVKNNQKFFPPEFEEMQDPQTSKKQKRTIIELIESLIWNYNRDLIPLLKKKNVYGKKDSIAQNINILM